MTDLSTAAEAALNKVTADAERYLLDRAAWHAVDMDSDGEWEARERMKASLERLNLSVSALNHLEPDSLLRADA